MKSPRFTFCHPPADRPAIAYAIGAATLGTLLVATGERGVCALLMGDDAKAVLGELAHAVPTAHLAEAEATLAPLLVQARGLIEAPTSDFIPALEWGGTPFQQSVWQALRRIPPGATASYADIARRIGRPWAVRAVANACAANLLAVAVPCHRVVRRDGIVSGYRWGAQRKQALLQREAQAAK